MSTTVWIVVLTISHLIAAGLGMWWGKLHPSAAAKILADAAAVEKKAGL